MRDTSKYVQHHHTLDDLINQVASNQGSKNNDNQSITAKLMSVYWNILKENPDYNLSQAIRERMGLNTKKSQRFQPQRLACYRMSKEVCCKESKKSASERPDKSKNKQCCESKSSVPNMCKCPAKEEKKCCGSTTTKSDACDCQDKSKNKICCESKPAVPNTCQCPAKEEKKCCDSKAPNQETCDCSPQKNKICCESKPLVPHECKCPPEHKNTCCALKRTIPSVCECPQKQEDTCCNVNPPPIQPPAVSKYSICECPPKEIETCCDGEPVLGSHDRESLDQDYNKNVCNIKPKPPKMIFEDVPLNKTLGDVNKALSFEKTCDEKITDLIETQKQLLENIEYLEEKEIKTMENLKQAQCMWYCMEEKYKKKIQDALEKQNTALKDRKEVETSVGKWRKNKKDLEFQITIIDKYVQDIKESMKAKTNKINCLRKEIEESEKRIESTTKKIKVVNDCIANKKKASNARLKKLSDDIKKIKKLVYGENNNKREKQLEGSKCAKGTREDLYQLYRLTLQKKLENEHLRTEKEALVHEIDMIKKTIEQCKEKCQDKDKKLQEELTKIDSEIADFKVRCAPCHKCIDTSDVRKLCTDCPRCAGERYCLYEDGHCFPDTAMDCVCLTTKEKFMDNVFKNMNTVLDNHIQTPAGKAVANVVLSYLRKSRNGKLNEETRKLLHDFVLTTVKKNLNSTIIGGAMKTRCEMDPDTYNQLMLCLEGIEVPWSPKEDRGTNPKKEPCRQWGGTSECNCPKGPKSCACTKVSRVCDPNMCKDTGGEVVLCPQKTTVSCGPNCSMKIEVTSSALDTALKQFPCKKKECSRTIRTMRAAQCILEPDCSSPFETKAYKTNVPYVPEVLMLYNQGEWNNGMQYRKLAGNRKGPRNLKQGIQERIGRHGDERMTYKDYASCGTVTGDIINRRSAFLKQSRCIQLYA